MGFDFIVRRPLRAKAGSVLEIQKDSQKQLSLSLAWPKLMVSEGGAEREFPIESCTVKPGTTDDLVHQGKKLFCIDVFDNKKKESHKWYTDKEEERKDWCFVLRKHAVHHNINNGFKVSTTVLGTGAFSTVLLAKDLVTFESIALKMIKKTRLNEEERKLLVEEIRIAQAVVHKYCVSTKEFIETEDTHILVMEYVGGGELFMKLAKHVYSEADVRRIFVQLMRGVAYLHSRGICHRDLKPENFLLTADPQPVVKIGDFGIAVDVDPSNKNACLKDGERLRCSPGYGAPEIVKLKNYGLPVDLWSLGVCLYLLLTGIQPYQGENEGETRQKMLSGVYDPVPLASCDPLAQDLLARLLDVNPHTRITAHSALDHAFLRDDFSGARDTPAGGGGCGCFAGMFGGRTLVNGQAFRDPSAHANIYTGAINPTLVDSSVRMGGKSSQHRGIQRSDYAFR
mmetsp:Transcript_27274/g.67271  ORF Transcript_27274/g.67271 Transcript_27274/m.67271 type:complete len:454 (-) Transcript_27274:194-1555(-)